jgi:Obg family GTPase CgtA-like protein
VEYWANRVPLTSAENFHRVYKKFQNKGIIDKLKKAGMKEEDTITVDGTMFTITYYGDGN